MISILIPVFNVDITVLVKELHKQATNEKVPFEIICLDDHSTNNIYSTNKSISDLVHCNYEVLPKNIGREKIRQRLASYAKYQNLLFLDCDVKINSRDYIQNYLDHSADLVVIGGIEYQETPPIDPSKFLRWKYGREREQKSAIERSKMRFSHFVASNLFIHKELFLSIAPSQEIKGYGHEDTLLGINLLKKGISLTQIDNPVEHLGLDSADLFLEKSLSGVKNLAQLYKNNLVGKELRIVNLYILLEKYHLKKIIRLGLKVFLDRIAKNLKSSEPKLSYFDLWKLYYFLLFCK